MAQIVKESNVPGALEVIHKAPKKEIVFVKVFNSTERIKKVSVKHNEVVLQEVIAESFGGHENFSQHEVVMNEGDEITIEGDSDVRYQVIA
jgi:hypothetical protein